jgi:hypothetical protein
VLLPYTTERLTIDVSVAQLNAFIIRKKIITEVSIDPTSTASRRQKCRIIFNTYTDGKKY